MKTFAIVMGAMFAMSAGACGGKKAEEAGGGEGGGDLPATCKKYIETVKACAAEAGDAGKSLTEALTVQERAWGRKGMDAGALETGCKAALDNAKAMGSMCPKVKWE